MQVLIGLLFVGALVAHAAILARMSVYRIDRQVGEDLQWSRNLPADVYARDNYTPAGQRLYLWLKWSALFVILLGLLATATAVGALSF